MRRTYEVIAVTTTQTTPVDATTLRRFLDPPRPTPPPPPPGTAVTKRCRPEALAKTVARAPEGGRNRALFWASCRMAEDGHSHTDALTCLSPAAHYAGLSDREIISTVGSAFRIAGPSHGDALGPTPSNEGIQL
jgi:hypothetical protein